MATAIPALAANTGAVALLEEKSPLRRVKVMRLLHFTIPVVFLSFSVLSFGQAEQTQKLTETQKAFEKLKALSGSWEGKVKTTPPMPEMKGDGGLMNVTLRTTSMGNALLHEMTGGGRPDDPITMLYLDEGRLLLTHYCDAGNRPRMTGKLSADGKRVEFDFLDIAGNTQHGHMRRAVFTFIDENRHTEDWTFMLKGDKPVQAHVDLQRKK
jgi:hypothetical protein